MAVFPTNVMDKWLISKRGFVFVNTTFHEQNLKKYYVTRNKNNMKIIMGSKFYNVEVRISHGLKVVQHRWGEGARPEM